LSATGDGFDVRSLSSTYPDGLRLGEHHHPWGQLVYARTGVMRVMTPGAAWTVPPTRAIWLPPERTHEIVMQGLVAMRTLYIAPERATALPAEATALEVEPLLRELILHVLTIGMLDPLRPAHDRLAGVLIDRIVAARPVDLFLPWPADSRALALAERLRAAPTDRSDISASATEAGASLRTLQRLFLAQTGLTIEAWRQKARLVHAASLLSLGNSVTNTAADCGYDSLSAFIAAFQRQFGVTPGRYRPARS
jgi:AraC-like DNA-binding protein